MRLNRISSGQKESVNGCERLANNLIGSKIVNATIQIGAVSNSQKKNTAVAAVIWFLNSIYICCQSTLFINCNVDRQLSIANCCRRRYFLFYLSDYKHSPIVFFWCVVAVATNRTKRYVQSKKSTIVIKLTVYKQPKCRLADNQCS